MNVFLSTVQSIRQNGLRSVLAGFGIAWGVFLLVIFLGVGNGFKNGVMEMFNAFAQKSMFVYGGQTSKMGSLLGENSQVFFDRTIVDKISRRYGCINSCSLEMTSSPKSVFYEGEIVLAQVKGVCADYFNIRILEIRDGRIFNPLDERKDKNVAVIGEGVEKTLFGNQDALGRMINIEGSLFKVVGVLSSDDLFSVQDRNTVYIPAASFISNFDSNEKVSSFCLSLSTDANVSDVEKDLIGYLAFIYGFDPHDETAIYISNIEVQAAAFESLFHGLELLIWIVGVCLLLSGIVGVCNVMFIIVKERTNEIGIRKAVGSTSISIISMIMAEAVTITVIAGMIGVLLGSVVILFADNVILPMLNTKIMEGVKINLMAVVASVVILCLSGITAGLFPALKASQISPVDAIRYENRG